MHRAFVVQSFCGTMYWSMEHVEQIWYDLNLVRQPETGNSLFYFPSVRLFPLNQMCCDCDTDVCMAWAPDNHPTTNNMNSHRLGHCGQWPHHCSRHHNSSSFEDQYTSLPHHRLHLVASCMLRNMSHTHTHTAEARLRFHFCRHKALFMGQWLWLRQAWIPRHPFQWTSCARYYREALPAGQKRPSAHLLQAALLVCPSCCPAVPGGQGDPWGVVVPPSQ